MATPLTDRINALTTYSNTVTGENDTTLSDAVAHLIAGYGGGGSSLASGTVTPQAASTELTFDTGLSTINGVLVYPTVSPFTRTRAQIGIIIIKSGSYFTAISLYTNSGGTGWIAPTGYTEQTRLTQSGTTVTIAGNYSWQTIEYAWLAW